MLKLKTRSKPCADFVWVKGQMNVKEYLYKQSKGHLIALGLAIVGFVGAIDHLTGPELFVSIFYLLPIFLVTWFAEIWMGVIICIASAYHMAYH